jgi:hypothetical protein
LEKGAPATLSPFEFGLIFFLSRSCRFYSHRLIIYFDSVFGLYHVVVGDVADVSEALVASVVRSKYESWSVSV